jgi:DeoR/GlpR family transcriptional regulator of sugar metabolism
VLTDSSKWGVVGLSSMDELSDASVIISDTDMSAQVSAFLSDRCDELVLVSPERDAAPLDQQR